MMMKPVLFALALVALVPCVGCGGPEGKTATITAGDMPEGQSWSGIYFHPVYGNLNLQENDNNAVIGKWQRAQKDKWGSLSGTKVGNVLHFHWTEHTYGLVGPSSSVSGKGYFVYQIGKDGIPALHGEYGLGEDETGSTWDCVKQMMGKNPLPPDMGSINGETPGGSAEDNGGGFK